MNKEDIINGQIVSYTNSEGEVFGVIENVIIQTKNTIPLPSDINEAIEYDIYIFATGEVERGFLDFSYGSNESVRIATLQEAEDSIKDILIELDGHISEFKKEKRKLLLIQNQMESIIQERKDKLTI
jgi:hypothetical protein